jgi:hypothetical protein
MRVACQLDDRRDRRSIHRFVRFVEVSRFSLVKPGMTIERGSGKMSAIMTICDQAIARSVLSLTGVV